MRDERLERVTVTPFGFEPHPEKAIDLILRAVARLALVEPSARLAAATVLPPLAHRLQERLKGRSLAPAEPIEGA